MDPQILARIARNNDQIKWKTEAVKLVFYIFPSDRRLEPLYLYSIATLILPLLKYILPFLSDINLEKAMLAAYTIEVYLLASYYSTLDWKKDIIAVAENIRKRFPVDTLTKERIELRKRILSRLLSY